MRALLLFFLALYLVPTADAQRGSFGIGGQVGNPTGLALKFQSGASAFDLAAGWDFDEYLFVQAHLLLRDRPLPGSDPSLRYFYGPGAFLGASDNRNDDLALGFSFNAGLAYVVDDFEFFGQLTPRLQLIEDTDFDVGGGIGVRYYP